MRWFTYMVQCGDNTLYAGVTNNLIKRIKMHNAKKGARYTAQRLPVTLIWHQEYSERGLALKREIEIKKMRRKQKIEIVKRFSQKDSVLLITRANQ